MKNEAETTEQFLSMCELLLNSLRIKT